MRNYQEYYRTITGLISNMFSNQRKTSRRRKHSPPQYSHQEFLDWVLSQPNFDALYTKWKKNDYNRFYVPSIDRIDDTKPYSFDNITLTDWKTNFDKGNSDRKSCKKITLHRPVWQLDLSGKKIRKFLSVASAARETGTQRVSLYKTCGGIYKTAGGYKWQYADNTSL